MAMLVFGFENPVISNPFKVRVARAAIRMGPAGISCGANS